MNFRALYWCACTVISILLGCDKSDARLVSQPLRGSEHIVDTFTSSGEEVGNLGNDYDAENQFSSSKAGLRGPPKLKLDDSAFDKEVVPSRALLSNECVDGACPLQSSTCDAANEDYTKFAAKLGDSIKSFLKVPDGGGFFDAMIDLYVKDNICVNTGANVRDVDGCWPEVCNRLPLYDTRCYLVTAPNSEFLENLIAGSGLPFAKEIIDAKNYFDTIVAEVSDFQEDAYNYLLPDAEEPGSCFAYNGETDKEMIGIAETPGFPPPLVYELCNCHSMKSTGVPYCTVQVYFTGFALSLGKDALFYDLQERLGIEDNFPVSKALYDGFVETSFDVTGDIWMGVDITIATPKLYKDVLGQGNPFQSLKCGPLTDTAKKAAKAEKEEASSSIPKTFIQGSVFLSNVINYSNEKELVALIAVEEVSIKLNFILEDFRLGAGFALVRQNSQNPSCYPSGFFASIFLGTDWGLGDGVKSFLNIPDSPTARADLGITWRDQEPIDLESFMSSVFIRINANVDLMGIRLNADAEIQYVSEYEFDRRRNFNWAECCTDGLVICDEQDSPITAWIKDPTIDPDETVALYLNLEQGNKDNSQWDFFTVMRFNRIEVRFLTQFSKNFAFELFIRADITALYVADIEAFVSVKIRDGGDQWFAEFGLEIDINVGLGVLTCELSGSVGVDEFRYDPSTTDSRALAQSSSFLEADWELDFSTSWATAEWLEDLGASILVGLKVIGEALEAAWNAVQDAAEEVWNAIVNLANLIGAAFEKLLEQIDNAADDIRAGAETLAAIFNDQANCALCAEVISGLGEAGAAVLKAGVYIVKGIGSIANAAFGTSRKNRVTKDLIYDISSHANSYLPCKTNASLACDLNYNCPVKYDNWKECQRLFGFDIDCENKNGKRYPDQDCVEKRAEQLEQMTEDAAHVAAQHKCRSDSEGRSQGIKSVGNGEVTAADLQASMEKTTKPLGKLSALKQDVPCEQLSFDVNVNALNTNEGGTGASVRQSSTSTDCVDFKDKQVLSNTLLKLKEDVSKTAQDASRGNQGLDKDSEISRCLDVSGKTCDAVPYLKSIGDDFPQTATIYCDDDLTNMNLESLFGSVTVENLSEICTTPPTARFSITRRSDSSDNCAPEVYVVTRKATDCCGQETSNVITQFLHVESRPPRFVAADGSDLLPGSMDIVLDCTENIHPFVLGYPGYVAGCEDATVDIDATDSSPLTDRTTCTTKINRTFTLEGDGCSTNTAAYIQTIELTDSYRPVWQGFPEDKVIGLFDPYGTDATGLPQAFAKCGAGPVTINYTDTMEEGNCFAERKIQRTFRSVDTCGKASVKNQIITIGNNANSLPLGDKSSEWLYAGSKFRIDNNNKPPAVEAPKQSGQNKVCSVSSVSSSKCGEADYSLTPTTRYKCGSSKEDEFSTYEKFLSFFISSPSLDEGSLTSTCDCMLGDDSCENLPNIGQLRYYGTQQVFEAGSCVYNERQDAQKNAGVVSVNGSDSRRLEGSDPVYNMFALSADDLNKTLALSAPASSVVLVNIKDAGDIDVGASVLGVLLEAHDDGEGDVVPANHILWNVPNEVNIRITNTSRPPYSFYGTMLNRRGRMELHFGLPAEVTWNGQLYCDRLNANGVDFDCAQFVGFAYCEGT